MTKTQLFNKDLLEYYNKLISDRVFDKGILKIETMKHT